MCSDKLSPKIALIFPLAGAMHDERKLKNKRIFYQFLPFVSLNQEMLPQSDYSSLRTLVVSSA